MRFGILEAFLTKAILHLTHPGLVLLLPGKTKTRRSAECPFYMHREYRPRENISFLENGTKIFALNPKTFVFVPEKSAGNPEVDLVRTVNIPFVVRRFLTHTLVKALFSQLCCGFQHILITQIVAT